MLDSDGEMARDRGGSSTAEPPIVQGTRIGSLNRAMQGVTTLLVVAIASCVLHRTVVGSDVDAKESFGFNSAVVTGIDDWGPSDVSAFITALSIDAGEGPIRAALTR